MRNTWWRTLITSGALWGWAGVTLYALLRYQPTDSSLWYVDTAMSVSALAWLRATYAGALVRCVGMGAWWFPVVLIHSAFVYTRSLWRVEWDRFVALIGMMIATSTLLVLVHGMWWRGQFVDGGVVGRWVAHHILPADSILSYIVVLTIMVCAAIVALRLSFVRLVCGCTRAIVWFFYQSGLIKKGVTCVAHLVAYLSYALAVAGRWIYHMLTGKPARDDAAVLLAKEQYEQLPTLASIVHDTIWESYTQQSVLESEKSAPAVVASVSPAVLGEGHETQLAYQLPRLALPRVKDESAVDQVGVREQARTLEHKLASFGIQGQVTEVAAGPLIYCFSYQPSVDTKLSRITALEDDLSLALQATSLRVIAPIPGTAVVGFEVAHKQRQQVFLAPLLEHALFKDPANVLPIALGVDSVGRPVVFDLTRMPHLLIAGATGSGKSVVLHSIIMSLLCRLSPDELKLVLIDPKRIELRAYADIAHLVCPIVTEPAMAVRTLQWLVQTMEQRYTWLAQKGARSIVDYHARYGKQGRLDMPFMVVIIDELADLMMSTRDAIEPGLVRLAQMARAAGIHLVVATQRPSVDVITGLIKVNFVSRIALRVTSAVDSRIIIDVPGAEKLLGYGDLLVLSPGMLAPLRAHGAYVTDAEIEQVCAHVRAQRMVHYETIACATESPHELAIDEEDNVLYAEVVQFLHEVDELSISLLQRRFKIGFNRSARIIERLELEGKITQPLNGKTRKVVRA